jgi:hypothetical protein
MPTFRNTLFHLHRQVGVCTHFVKCFTLEDGMTGCPKTSVRNFHSTLRKTPEERRSRVYRGESLKSWTKKCFRWGKFPYNVSSLNPGDCKTFPPMACFRYAQVSFRTGFTIFQLHDFHVNRWHLLWNTLYVNIIIIIIIIIYLLWSWATCWPFPVSRTQKSLQKSAIIPFARLGIA